MAETNAHTEVPADGPQRDNAFNGSTVKAALERYDQRALVRSRLARRQSALELTQTIRKSRR